MDDPMDISWTDRSAVKGMNEQLASLLQAHLDDLVRYAFARTGSREDAEDVAMDVVQDALRHGPGLLKRPEPRLYLLGMARRKIADLSRKQARRHPNIESTSLGFSDDVQVVTDILLQLAEAHREVLVLKYVQELSVIEIGRVMRKSPQAVNSLLQRARGAFAEAAGDGFSEMYR